MSEQTTSTAKNHQEPAPQQAASSPQPNESPLGIAGFVVGLLHFIGIPLAVVGLPLSIAGYMANKKTGANNALSTAGIVINSIFLALGLIVIFIVILFIALAAANYNGQYDSGPYHDYDTQQLDPQQL